MFILQIDSPPRHWGASDPRSATPLTASPCPPPFGAHPGQILGKDPLLCWRGAPFRSPGPEWNEGVLPPHPGGPVCCGSTGHGAALPRQRRAWAAVKAEGHCHIRRRRAALRPPGTSSVGTWTGSTPRTLFFSPTLPLSMKAGGITDAADAKAKRATFVTPGGKGRPSKGQTRQTQEERAPQSDEGGLRWVLSWSWVS